ncbi:hypothetical protein BpHYR1_019475 [Brachionus plicatilis]|uniref:Uncharacterized protein n=1 Tax=Brachionus plicatilis TaxID=10195 RepID=A0A3M7RBP0_BRAPC|nr:hypothetical protein BpHYR1_019475 [Brachionus plicatilis]
MVLDINVLRWELIARLQRRTLIHTRLTSIPVTKIKNNFLDFIIKLNLNFNLAYIQFKAKMNVLFEKFLLQIFVEFTPPNTQMAPIAPFIDF